MPLFKVSIPANAQTFFNQIIKIASFDIISTDSTINKLLNLNSTNAFNANFDGMGFSSMFFMNNMGTMFLTFIFYSIAIFGLFMLDKCLSNFQKIGKFIVS